MSSSFLQTNYGAPIKSTERKNRGSCLSTGSVVIFVCMVPIHSTVAAARSPALTIETIYCLISTWEIPPTVATQERYNSPPNPTAEEFHSANRTIRKLAQSDRHYIDAPPDQGAHHQQFVRSSAGDSYFPLLSHPYSLIMKKCSCESSIVKCEVPINNSDHP